MMKKLTSLLLSVVMLVSLLACGASAKTLSAKTLRIAGLKGPTTMGLVNLLSMEKNGTAAMDYDLQLYGAADEIVPKLIKGNLDMAAIPANLAATLYQKTNGGIQVLAVNTLGVLYIVESGESVSSVADLRGRTIYASGKGATPEYALNYILSENGVDPEKDVNIEWKSEHAECLAALLAEENAVAMLPQPFVTTAQMKNDKIKVRLDLNAEWDAVQAGSDAPSQLITGVVAARKAFIEENPEAVAAFMESYAASVEFVNANVDEAAELIGKYEIVPAAVAKKAIPACNITFLAGREMRQALSGYLNVLFEQNPKAVGGALPGEDFYYGGN